MYCGLLTKLRIIYTNDSKSDIFDNLRNPTYHVPCEWYNRNLLVEICGPNLSSSKDTDAMFKAILPFLDIPTLWSLKCKTVDVSNKGVRIKDPNIAFGHRILMLLVYENLFS